MKPSYSGWINPESRRRTGPRPYWRVQSFYHGSTPTMRAVLCMSYIKPLIMARETGIMVARLPGKQFTRCQVWWGTAPSIVRQPYNSNNVGCQFTAFAFPE